MTVRTLHPDYRNAADKWNLVRDIVKNEAKHLIRKPDAEDPQRSKQYQDDAILTNFTRLTKNGLTGLIFRKPAEMDLPEQISYLSKDATGFGFGLEQLSRQVAGEILMTGRYGLLVDYPQSEDEDKARITPYTAGSIINWKYKKVGSENRLALVVLKEKIDTEGAESFVWNQEDKYRVLRINKDGIYQQEEYDKSEKLISTTIPLNFNGQPFTEIPFVFVGSENNDDMMDDIPLYDMAVVNLGHYRNSADLEESIFINGQPYPVINVGESSAEEFESANPGGVRFGSRAGLVLSNGGDAKLLQAQANQMVSVEMKRKEEQAAAIGARLIAPSGGRETAEGAKIRYGSQHSTLHVIAVNIDNAIEKCLAWVSQFMMEVPDIGLFELNKKFFDESADPATVIQQLVPVFDRNIVTVEEARRNLKELGLKLDDDFVQIDVAPIQDDDE